MPSAVIGFAKFRLRPANTMKMTGGERPVVSHNIIKINLEMPLMNAVEMQAVTKTFGSHLAVDDLELAVPEGSVYGFIGPNGSGKTTTMRMIMNILVPDRGEIRTFGQPTSETSVDRIGYMPEERGLYKRMKVRDVLEFYGGLKNGRNLQEEISSWLERFTLADRANKRVETLSKGMTQKVQFIATVVSKPDLLILDEPFTGLDPVNADVIREAILELSRQGTTIILSTHDMSVAEKMCDFILMIYRGEKVLDGTLAAIQDQYGSDTIRIRSDATPEFLGSVAGVTRVRTFGKLHELQIADSAVPQDVVGEIMSRAKVLSFDITKPSLHDIFVRIAGPTAEEVTSA
jgi:ABC-2 type transport system ATP-binding protein